MDSPVRTSGTAEASYLVAHFEHQIETKTHKEDVRHPAGDQRRQDPATSERDRDRVCRPIAEADGECLSDAHGHTAPSDAAPTQTQRSADHDHDHGHERERDPTVIVCFEACRLRVLLMSTSSIGADIMERHQLGIAGEPRGEVIGNEGQCDGFVVELRDRNGPIGGKSAMPYLVQGPASIDIAGFVGLGDVDELEVAIELKETHAAQEISADGDARDMHERVSPHSRPGLLEFHSRGRRLFLDAGSPDLFGLACSERDDGGTEQQEDEGNPCSEGNEGGGNPG